MNDFWFMNGYGIYIWPSYAFAAIVLGGLTVYLWRKLRRLESELR